MAGILDFEPWSPTPTLPDELRRRLASGRAVPLMDPMAAGAGSAYAPRVSMAPVEVDDDAAGIRSRPRFSGKQSLAGLSVNPESLGPLLLRRGWEDGELVPIGAPIGVMPQNLTRGERIGDLTGSALTGAAGSGASVVGLPRAAARLLGFEPSWLPQTEDVRKTAEKYTGRWHEPRTQAGDYAHGAGEMAPFGLVGAARVGLMRALAAMGLYGGYGAASAADE